jgi:hypothetical protein
MRGIADALDDLNIKNPKRHHYVDRVGTGPGMDQIAARLDELAKYDEPRLSEWALIDSVGSLTLTSSAALRV